ncbi:MAG: acylneuraminate cytidylyltransferase family protein [Planctomycetia bacterium]|nr:acylneuraminate cytidylyltransferase family protein [Planctomycetia bacterium]
MKILGVIPARGGSKGVPRKNIRPLCGAPLLAWTVDCARRTRLITRVCVSTEDEEIRRVGLAWGAEAPFLRPAELATDRALAVPTIQHAVREMEARTGERYDVVAMLQPTSPLKTPEDLDAALGKLIATPEATGIITVVDVDNWHPMKMQKFLGEGGRGGRMVDYEKPPKENVPRQELPPVFMVNGVMYATRRDVLMDKGTFRGDYCLGHVMPAERSVNIDSESDFVLAEYECRRQGRIAPQPAGAPSP